MTVVKQYNPTTSAWEPVVIGKTGPRGPAGPPGSSNIPWVDLADYGAKYDGSDDAPAFNAAILDIDPFTHLHISGPVALGSPIVCNKVITLTGEGMAAPIYPLPTFPPNEFLFTFQYQNKKYPGESHSHLANICVDNVLFDGNLRSVRCGGLRLWTIQESFFSRLKFENINGRGLWAYRSTRDSIFQTIMARQCGNFDAHEAQIDLGETVLGSTQDSNNNLAFYGLYSHIGWGDLLSIESADPDTSAMRVFMFVNCKFHGVWSPGVTLNGFPGGYENTGRVLVRNAKNVIFTNCRFNAWAPGMPALHVGPYPTQPGSNSNHIIDLTNISFGNSADSMIGTVSAAAGNDLTTAAAHHFATGMMVRATATTITGIATDIDYFTIRVNTTTMRLATSYKNAEAGTAMTTGATGTATLETQGVRIYIDEGTYGTVRENPGVDFDGPGNRCPIVSKSHLQVLRQYGTVDGSIFDPLYYDGVISEAYPEQHGNVSVDGVLDHGGTKVGFYGTTPVVKPTGVTAAAALQALGLGSGLTEGGGGGGASHTSEVIPPLTARSPGMTWLVPSVGHMAIWSVGPTGATWFPIAPANPEQNICCIVGLSDYIHDLHNWDGITGSVKWVNDGKDYVANAGATVNANVTQATDASGRKYAVMNNTTTDAIIGGGFAMRDVAAGDSFSAWVIKSQAAYIANSNLIATRVSAITVANVGWTLGGGPTTNGVQTLRISDGTTMVEALSAPVPVNQIKLTLGIRNVATDTVEIHTGTDAGVSIADTTTGSLVALDVPRISRAAGTGTGRTAQSLYMVGWTKRAYTTTEVATLKTWAAARFA